MQRRYIIICLLLLPILAFISCKSAKLSDAIEKHERGEYYDAAQIYRKVYGKTPSEKVYLRGAITFQMGECYRLLNNPNRALGSYINAVRFKYPDSTAYLYQGQMSQMLGKYSDAIKYYNTYLEYVPNSLLAKNGIIGCELAPEWKKNPSYYVVKKMELFNSREGEFSPILIPPDNNQLLITSSRKGVVGEEKSSITGVMNNDFFLVKQDEKGQWLKPEVIESGVNTEFDEGTGSFSSDGSQMYYTYCSQDFDTNRTAEIRLSSRSEAKWNAGTQVEIFKDSTLMASHPAVGPDGYLYFVSDMMGGFGGKDIWRILIADIGVSYPENLGPEINTPADEMFPYMRQDTVLFFSSNGHPGMGGLDIFKAQKDNNDKWRVENLKYPINSSGDDFGITFFALDDSGKESGFFSSNRNDKRGADHIYSFYLPGVYLYIEGWVLNREEEEIKDARIRIVGKDGTNQQLFARSDGTYFLPVTPGVEYVMMGSAPGYLNQRQTLEVPHRDKSETFYVDFYLNSISKPEVIENIFYDFDKATLRPESKNALDTLIMMLEDNPNITIELSAHTDRKGTEEYNINLSQRRAQSVVDYLIRHGIETDRLTAVGYGKTRPQTVTKSIFERYEFLPEGQVLSVDFIETLAPEEQAIADQINRRTEFMVLSTDYGLF
ncbi:OmpA family protein [Bacteroidales bacterium OttesenSCG-928-M11]|nr:OmpA family protein [Bacteroidales bacterium OttesenSCG-928-M11]